MQRAPWIHITETAFDLRDRKAWRAVTGQPNWVVRVALLTFLIVIALPVVFLMILAFIAAVIAFGVLALVNAIGARLRGGLPHRDGRRNVRVLPRRPD